MQEALNNTGAAILVGVFMPFGFIAVLGMISLICNAFMHYGD